MTLWFYIKGVCLAAVDLFILSSPYLLIGFSLSGFFYVFISRDRVFKHLGGKDWRSVYKAALFGIPLPLCSCGVIPTALSLRRQGASVGATLSFLISTPETGIDSISLTYALMDPVFTVFRPLAAFLTAVVTGTLANWLPAQPMAADNGANCHICGLFLDEGHTHTWWEKTGKMFSYAYGEFLGDIALWLLVGFLLAGLITFLLPDEFFLEFLGQGFLAMLIMLLAGIPLYICATSTTPIAAALLMKGVAPGAVLVFMLSGPATNVATLTMVFKYLGRAAGMIYLASIAGMSLLLGYALNYFYDFWGQKPVAFLGAARELFPESLNNYAAVILALLIFYALYREFTHPDSCSHP